VRIGIERRQPAAPQNCILQITPACVDAGILSKMEGVLGSMPVGQPFSLECAATSDGPWLSARAESDDVITQLHTQLGARFQHAVLGRSDKRPFPPADPGRLADGERLVAGTFKLRTDEYLPVRTFDDTALEASPQADPLVGILKALGSVPEGWRAIAQLVLRRAPHNWADKHRRRALEPLPYEQTGPDGPVSMASVRLFGGLIWAVLTVLGVWIFFQSAQWLNLLQTLATSAAVAGVGLGIHRLNRTAIYDRKLVAEKLDGIGYQAELRIAVVAPVDASDSALNSCLDRIASSYGQFNLGSGNGLVFQPLKRPEAVDLRSLQGLPGSSPCLLTAHELRSLWHLPHSGTDVALLERNSSRRLLPLPDAVRSGCFIGWSRAQDKDISVCLPDYLLRRNLLMVAKTGSGKSSLMLHMARHLMDTQPSGEDAPALLMVDPHEDLARTLLGLVPAHKRGEVIYLDASNTQRPFGFNFLDVGLGWERDKALRTTLTVLRREYNNYWGPRMENAFSGGLRTLYEANLTICARDPLGRKRQYTLLDTPAVLLNHEFRKMVRKDVHDPEVDDWWNNFFAESDNRIWLDSINPVLTKVYRLRADSVTYAIVGQPVTTIDPRAWLKPGTITIVNTSQGELQEATAAVIGAALVNLAALAVAEQAAKEPSERRRLTLMVDEMQTIPGISYESIVSGLGKFGANLIAATQSLSSLDVLDNKDDDARGLKANVFANIKGLFVFGVSAEDGEYLAPELGRGLEKGDLTDLGDHHCYVRMPDAKGQPLPPFSVELQQPPRSDRCTRDTLAAASAALYGRDIEDVREDLRAALDRVRQAHDSGIATEPGRPGEGVSRDAPVLAVPGSEPEAKKEPRSHYKAKGKGLIHVQQGTLLSLAGDGNRPAPEESSAEEADEVMPRSKEGEGEA